MVAPLLLWLAASAGAAGPDLTLALADRDQLQAPSGASTPVDIQSISRTPLFDLKSSPPASSSPENTVAVNLAADARLEPATKSDQADPLPVLPENGNSASQSNVTFSVHAGYGRIWGEQSMLQKISAGHQEAGCAYVSANISF